MQKTLCRSLIFCLLAVTACTVKEDRSECPCILTIDFSSCHESKDALSIKGWTGSSTLFGTKVLVKDYPDGIKFMVPRGSVCYSVCSDIPSYRQIGSVVYCPFGNQAEPMFAYRQTVITDGETAVDRVVLHKQYAVLNISFGMKGDTMADISKVIIKAGCNGMSIEDLSPVEGDFEYVAYSDDGFFNIRVPRQMGDLLTMEAYAGDEIVKAEDLAALLSSSGYRWDTEDLDDAWIDFDMGRMETTIAFEEWKEGDSYLETI